LFAIALLVMSCEKAFIPENGNGNPQAVFEELWTGINEKYSLFGFTTLNWDSVRNVYQQRISPSMSQLALYDSLTNMIFLLKDGHTNIIRASSGKYYNYANTSIYPVNYYRETILNIYFNVNQPIIVHNNYGYCRLRTSNIGFMIFGGQFDDRTTEDDYIKMLEYFKDSKGLIIDLRQNGGGNDAIVKMMLSHFTDKKLLVGKVKYKSGKEHSSFGEWYPTYVEPQKPFFDKKIVILTNRAVYSAANEMVLWSKAFPNITRVGTKTGGGIGIPSFHFLSNGWWYRTSSSIIALPDGTVVFDGTEPDFEVITNSYISKDALIEKALQILN